MPNPALEKSISILELPCFRVSSSCHRSSDLAAQDFVVVSGHTRGFAATRGF